jgi:outer membrane protein assembly factor BamD (BamD/ComL family)
MRILVLAALLALTGCDTPSWFRRDEPAIPPGMVFQDGKLVPDPTGGRGSPELAAAHEQFRAGDFVNAESAFHKIAENTHNAPAVGEEARFYEAESMAKQDKLPKACDTYHKMLIDFPAGTYRDQAVRRMFDIANYWLDDTRTEMTEYREKKEGKRTFVVPAAFHFEKKKPWVDEEGRALQALEQVHLNDITGPMADKALFLAGGVKFFREDYKEADHFFSQLVEQHPNSPMASQAVELAIISKSLSTGGADYDGRKVAEARIMVDTALRNYPQLAAEKSGFFERQIGSITYQQAEKDYSIGEFYRRTGHPGSAYFYYEIVRRRYPGTKWGDMATDRMQELRAKVGQERMTQPSMFDGIAESVDRVLGRTKKLDPEIDDATPRIPPANPQGPPRSLPSDLAPRS